MEHKERYSEEQFILRLHPALAERMREVLDSADHVEIDLHFETPRTGKLRFGNDTFPMRLVDLPCVVETYKMHDKGVCFKSNDIGQMVIVHEDEASFPTEIEWRDGLTPPMRSVRRQRFRDRPKFEKSRVETTEKQLWRIMQGAAGKGDEILEEVIEEDDDEEPGSRTSLTGYANGSVSMTSTPAKPDKKKKKKSDKGETLEDLDQELADFAEDIETLLDSDDEGTVQETSESKSKKSKKKKKRPSMGVEMESVLGSQDTTLMSSGAVQSSAEKEQKKKKKKKKKRDEDYGGEGAGTAEGEKKKKKKKRAKEQSETSGAETVSADGTKLSKEERRKLKKQRKEEKRRREEQEKSSQQQQPLPTQEEKEIIEGEDYASPPPPAQALAPDEDGRPLLDYGSPALSPSSAVAGIDWSQAEDASKAEVDSNALGADYAFPSLPLQPPQQEQEQDMDTVHQGQGQGSDEQDLGLFNAEWLESQVQVQEEAKEEGRDDVEQDQARAMQVQGEIVDMSFTAHASQPHMADSQVSIDVTAEVMQALAGVDDDSTGASASATASASASASASAPPVDFEMDAKYQALVRKSEQLARDVASLDTKISKLTADAANAANPIIKNRFEKQVNELTNQRQVKLDRKDQVDAEIAYWPPP